MKLFDYFRRPPKSASLAKDRLSIIGARDTRAAGKMPDVPAAAPSRSCSRSSRATR